MANSDFEMEKLDIKKIIEEVRMEKIPIGISNRHIHLTQEHFEKLFPGEKIEVLKWLKQPGEFAAKQTVTIVGTRGEQQKVRILGPLRKKSQVEISKTDARILGINAPIKLSGNLEEAAEITLKNGGQQVTFNGCIVAKRHIHLSTQSMELLGLHRGQSVSVKIEAPERSVIFSDVEIRPGDNFILEMHLDVDEANAANVGPKTTGSLIL